MAKLKVEVKGMDRLRKILNKLKAKVIDLSPVWPAIRDDFYKIEKKRFESSNKGRWRPLNPNYAI